MLLLAGFATVLGARLLSVAFVAWRRRLADYS